MKNSQFFTFFNLAQNVDQLQEKVIIKIPKPIEVKEQSIKVVKVIVINLLCKTL